MDEKRLDPEKGREVAAGLRNLGVRGILVTAAELGHINKLECAMPTCRCPEELGGTGHFDQVPEALPEWMPTVDHIQPKSEKGTLTFDNIRLAHRLCNRVHHADTEGRSIKKDLEKVEAARTKAIEGSSKPPMLKTKRLELKPSMPALFDSVWAAIKTSAAELAVWMHWAIKLDPDATREYLVRAAEAWESGHDRAFTLFLDGKACGQCSLDHTDPLSMSAQIGYWMRSDLCGKNLMTEAAYEVVSYGFWQEGLHRIELHAGVDNHASIRVAEKLGFQKEGTHRHSGRGANGFYDSYSFGLLRTDERPELDRLDSDPRSR